LREQEDSLKSARAETDLISPEALEGLNLQAKDLRDRLQEMRARGEGSRAQAAQVRDLRDSGDRAAIVEQTGDPTLRRLLGAIRDGDADAPGMFAQRLDTVLANMASEADRMASQADALSDSYSDLQERIERQSNDLVRIEQMAREVETTRTLYETFLTRLKETTVQRGLQQADSRILSDAIPGQKVAPRTSRILALSMLLGLMIGAAVVLVRQFLHKTFRVAEDVEAVTGLPVLGQIPKMPIGKRSDLIDVHVGPAPRGQDDAILGIDAEPRGAWQAGAADRGRHPPPYVCRIFQQRACRGHPDRVVGRGAAERGGVP
jgi:hypothetical protein